MATATLQAADRSVIELILTNAHNSDRAYLAVHFIDSANPPTGKLVKIAPTAGTAMITGWTNATNPGAFRDLPRISPGGATINQEYSRYTVASGSHTFLISTFKAASNNVPITTKHDATQEVTLADATHADSNGGRRFQVKQWTFDNGSGQVIITIVMIDDEGGGDGSDGDEEFLRLTLKGEIFEIGARRVRE